MAAHATHLLSPAIMLQHPRLAARTLHPHPRTTLYRLIPRVAADPPPSSGYLKARDLARKLVATYRCGLRLPNTTAHCVWPFDRPGAVATRHHCMAARCAKWSCSSPPSPHRPLCWAICALRVPPLHAPAPTGCAASSFQVRATMITGETHSIRGPETGRAQRKAAQVQP